MRETANKEENKLVTLTVAECSEFHSMGEFHENIRSAAEAVSKFKEIPPERMHGMHPGNRNPGCRSQKSGRLCGTGRADWQNI